jgi:hypothetical protein
VGLRLLLLLPLLLLKLLLLADLTCLRAAINTLLGPSCQGVFRKFAQPLSAAGV